MKIAILLAGGYGTRATHLDVPKPLIKYGNETLIERLVSSLAQYVDTISVLANMKDAPKYAMLFYQHKYHDKVTIITEPHESEEKKYGSYYAFALHVAYLKGVYTDQIDSLIAVPGDGIYAKMALWSQLLSGLKEKQATISIMKVPSFEAKHFGTVEFNTITKSVLGFQEKVVRPRSDYAWTGAIAMRGSVLPSLDSTIHDHWGYIITSFISKGMSIKAVKIRKNSWADVGNQSLFSTFNASNI